MEVVEELSATAKGYKSYESWFLHIEEYTSNMKKNGRLRQQEEHAVTLATFHGAKGLEFDKVYLIDANEGIIPYKKAVLDKDIEEERRLFYVGMTRAKNVLKVCYVDTFNDKAVTMSRFIQEVMKNGD